MNIINSHIQMPKCVLKQFATNNRLAYYDVKKQHIGINGHAKSIYTELGYYSKETEERLNKEVETPFSKVLSQVKGISFEASEFYKPKRFDASARKYLDSLLVRSPVMQDAIKQNSIFYAYLPRQTKHDIAVNYGLNMTAINSFTKDFFTTFLYNKTGTQLILPVCGMYECMLYGYLSAIVPVTPSIAIVLLHKTAINAFTKKEDSVSVFYISDDSTAKWLNNRAIKKQVSYGEGFVVASNKRFLEEALELDNE